VRVIGFSSEVAAGHFSGKTEPRAAKPYRELTSIQTDTNGKARLARKPAERMRDLALGWGVLPSAAAGRGRG
jgi:hypothetical protein